MPDPSLQLIRQVWGRRPCQWLSQAALGALGGIWLIWNPSEHSLQSSLIGNFSVTAILVRLTDGLPWKFTAVYGTNSTALRTAFWEELDRVASLPHPIWCLGGDVNITRWSFEKNSNPNFSAGMADFEDFISRNDLLDIPLEGNLFTWSDHSAQPTLSKLDRFLPSRPWDESFPSSNSLALPKPTSDHCPILLDTQPVLRGPKPFRVKMF
ncbi:hypothetical protein AMTRI_Chr02g213300 [Amborella trichopoda]